jgi:hypothetical protein
MPSEITTKARRTRRTEATIAAFVLGALCVLVVSSSVAGEVIERILAVVDGRPVMLSEVRLLQRVRGADQAAAVEALIDERLMFREASRLPQAAVTAEEEERAYVSVRASRPSAWAAEADLRRLARRQTAILKYIEFRFRPQVRIADDEIVAAYEREYGGRDGAPSLEAASGALRERLEAQALDERIEAWVRELRGSAEIRYNR